MPARSPPHSRLWGPLGEGGALCNRRSTTVPVSESCRTSSTLQHHSPGGCTGDCDLQLHQAGKQMDSWLGQFGTRHDDDEAFRRGEHMGRVGFDSRNFFPWNGRSPVSHPTCEVPANIGKGWSRLARCTRVSGDRFGIPNPRKSGSVIVADRQRSGLSCVLLKRVPQGRTNGEWGYSTRRQCWATSAQRRCHPQEALYLPTFSHLFDCQ